MIPPLVAILVGPEAERRAGLLLEGAAPEAVCPEGVGLEQLPALPLRRLVPDTPRPSMLDQLLDRLTPEALVPGLQSHPDGLGLLAGLYQLHDRLEKSHSLAQRADEQGPNTTGAYWHGIMHRREPDYDNARYWFRRVGDHPIFAPIGREVSRLLAKPDFAATLGSSRLIDRHGHWDPNAFIALCEECGRNNDQRSTAAEKLQEVEMRQLLEYSCRAAGGSI